MISFPYLDTVVILLLVSVFIVIICRKFKISLIIGYIITGFLIGPSILGILPNTHLMANIGEIGIVFLMFTIGLEFSLTRLKQMWRYVLELGGLQVFITIVVFSTLGIILGFSFSSSFAVGAALCVSSTAIVSKLLSDKQLLNSRTGQMVMGILLMQDLAVVPIMIIMNSMTGSEYNIYLTIFLAILKMSAVLFFLVFLGEKIMNPWFNLIAKQKIDELFIINVLLVVLGVALLTMVSGLSLELGAFVSGILISETKYRYQVDTDIKPFKDILLGFFFITIGLKLNLSFIINDIENIMLFFFALILVKFTVVFVLGLRGRYGKMDSFKTALYLAQGGEFGFVLAVLAEHDKFISSQDLQLITSVILMSMMIFPLMIKIIPLFEKIEQFFLGRQAKSDLKKMPVLNTQHPLILIGYGVVGQTVARLLKEQDIDYFVIDKDINLVNSAKLSGEPIIYGDARQKDILVAAGINHIKLMVLTLENIKEAEFIISRAMSIRPWLEIIALCKQQSDIDKFYQLGASAVVIEKLEAGFSLTSETLLNLGKNYYETFSFIRKIRLKKYFDLQDFFQAGESPIDFKSLYRDSLIIRPDDYFNGRTLQELYLFETGIKLISIRRDGVQINIDSIDEGFVFLENDVIVAAGTPLTIQNLKSLIASGE